LNNLTKHIENDEGGLRKNTELSNIHSIVFSKATAKWTDDQTCNILENINISVSSGQLIAIIGPMGAGKVCKNNFKLILICHYFKKFIIEFAITSYSTRITTF